MLRSVRLGWVKSVSDSKVTAVMAVSVIAVCVYHNSCCCFEAEAFATMAITVVTTVAAALAVVVVATVAVVVVAVAAAAATTILSLSAVRQIGPMAPFVTAVVATAVDAQ